MKKIMFLAVAMAFATLTVNAQSEKKDCCKEKIENKKECKDCQKSAQKQDIGKADCCKSESKSCPDCKAKQAEGRQTQCCQEGNKQVESKGGCQGCAARKDGKQCCKKESTEKKSCCSDKKSSKKKSKKIKK